LTRLKDERLPRLEGRLQETLLDGGPHDLDVHLTREEMARVYERILELERILDRAPEDEAANQPGTAAIGSQVVARDDTGRIRVFVIVSPIEADAGRGHISAASPVGSALLGRRAGDRVTVVVPTGERTFSVISVG
jgi:transcription elongation factor GreA